MEKVLKRYWIDDINKVIDKHIKYHQEALEEEMESHASAIASLLMLKSELNGEVEY